MPLSPSVERFCFLIIFWQGFLNGGSIDRLRGMDAREIGWNPSASEPSADEPGQRTSLGFPQRTHADEGGIGSKRCAHAGDQWNASQDSSGDELDLRGQGVYGIDDHVRRAGEDSIDRLQVDEEIESFDLAIGVDIPDPLPGDLYLGASQRRVEGKKLAVDVAGPNHIEVDHPEATDSGPGEPFHGVAPGGAESDHDRM